MIKVSIIVPVYKVEQYLTKCMESLVNQTLKDIEIICVDDGSPDNSLSILKAYAEKDSRVLVLTQQNKRQGAARNNGIRLAQGEYIGFVDSDDWVDLDYFEKLYNKAKETDADVALASVLKHRNNYTKYNVQYKKVKLATDIQERIKLSSDKKQNFFNCWNKLYRASLLKDNNITFPEKMVYEDVIFAIKVLYAANSVVSVPNTDYHYLHRMDSTVRTKENIEQKKADHARAYKELAQFAKEKNIVLAERLNYFDKIWLSPLMRVYTGVYRDKYTLFGWIPVWVVRKDKVA